MNTAENDNIPTLTDIVQAGDESMKNHFDASFFNESETDETLETDALSDELKEKVESLIEQALEDTLPSIELQLKQQLTKKIIQELNAEASEPNA